jgi:molybdopterin molybdotransferase
MNSYDGTPSMLSVEEARQRIVNMFDTLAPENKAILETLGQVLAADVVSNINVPPLDNSSMDGYAVLSDNTIGASKIDPTILRIIDEISAGEVPKTKVLPGTGIRIMTGAAIPSGANAVVPFEDTDEFNSASARISNTLNQDIRINVEVNKGANIRPVGQDIKKGQVILTSGTILRPPEVGILASIGKSSVEVIRKPTIAVIATGNELIEPGTDVRPGSIYDSNSYGICAAISKYGGIPKFLGIAKDEWRSLEAKIEEALDADLLITSAGVSKGDYDIVKDLLSSRGKIDFWSVRMRPAKPLAFGTFEAPSGKTIPHIGLPGNPVSALVAFELLVRPAILKMLGKIDLGKSVLKAVLKDDIVNTDGRRVYARVIVSQEEGTFYASLTGDQGSGVLTSMVMANGLAICPEDIDVVKAGEVVSVQMLDWPDGITI